MPDDIVPLVKIRGLRFSRGDRVIFDGVDIDIPRGKITAIMGPSGTGKTTLLKLIGGQLRPHAGSIEVDIPRVISIGIVSAVSNLSIRFAPLVSGTGKIRATGKEFNHATGIDIDQIPGSTVIPRRIPATMSNLSKPFAVIVIPVGKCAMELDIPVESLNQNIATGVTIGGSTAVTDLNR